jgi:nitric oxide reductase subunit B
MKAALRLYLVFALLMLIATLLFGLVATWAFLNPEMYNRFLPFYQLRPFHVSAALFWILSGATTGLMVYRQSELPKSNAANTYSMAFIYSWMLIILAIFACYAFKIFGGREYWEFPPVLCIPLLFIWILLMISYFIPWSKASGKQPLYVWMWSTGVVFFLLTFIEQNLWQIPWFRYSLLREVTVQWKSNGSMVGAWNQMIYGTSLYLMVKISGDKSIARGPQAFFFYFLGLSNLMFNWGHHIYNVPTANWIRDGAYLISMTELLFLWNIIRGFRNKLQENKRLRHLITYRFLIAAEFWVFMNLILALCMSVPAVNRYTHGTHITVAHAMGATIGINSMILLASFSYLLGIDEAADKIKKKVLTMYWLSQVCLMIFWLSLIAAGILKGYRMTVLGMKNFQEIMQPVYGAIKVLSVSGVGLVIGLGMIALVYIKRALSNTTTFTKFLD